MNLQERNYYDLFGLSNDALLSDIEAAYQGMRALYAPDGEHPDPEAFEYIQHAYQVLADPQRRALFDSLLIEAQPSLSVSLSVSANMIAVVDEPQALYLLGELRVSSDRRQAAHRPLNLAFVVDRSTSMKGERLQQVKQALQSLIPQLAADDYVSLVSFSDRAEIVLPACPVGEQRDLSQHIEAIEASGGTEIYHGLLAGLQQLRRASPESFNSQLVLLTDGRTYGDEAACLRLATEAATMGITIQAFGIGPDWDDEFIDALAAPSGGSVAYIDGAEQIVETLHGHLDGLGKVDAQQIRLRNAWPQSVTYLEGLRLTPFTQAFTRADDSLLLGDLRAGHSLSFLLTFTINPQPIPTRIRIPVELSAELPGAGSQMVRDQAVVNIVPEAPPLNPPQPVVRAVRLATLYHMHERAWREAQAGQLDLAATRMRRLSTRLLEEGEPQLARQAGLEAQQLARTGALSAHGHKQLKYGTRALTRKTLQLKGDDSM